MLVKQLLNIKIGFNLKEDIINKFEEEYCLDSHLSNYKTIQKLN